ncbi:MAG: FkbM family methyltransferase [Cyclobacteriaceae bacterium]|nr:FkbM family methyltransferase [Cyclobacteriaceae bacterium]
MLNFIKRKIEKHRLKRTFQEYGSTINEFNVDGIGVVKYAQWLHPLESKKEVTTSNVGFYKKLVRPGATIIDIGAHTGDTTVPMALACGKEGLVIALEPNPYVFKILEANAKLNQELTNIDALCFAATEKEGDFVFHYSDASFCNGGFLTQLKNQQHNHSYTLTVKGKNLQDYLYNHYQQRLPRVELLKVDAEGYDKEILKGMSKFISTYKPIIMAECYKKLTLPEREELFDVISNNGYDLFYLEGFEENARKEKIERSNMNDRRHFEILAFPKQVS